MSSMDKLIPQNPTPITNSSTTTATPPPHWDLPIASMDAHHHHHHQILQDHHTNHLFPFASLPTWSNYSPLLLPPPPPIIHHISSSSSSPPPPPSSSSLVAPRITKQMQTLAEGEEELAEEEDGDEDGDGDEDEELGAMKEMMYKIAAMQPVEIDPATIRRPKRRNVRISDDPQSVAARLRRERISEKIRILQRLVPGGTKLDTASMLDEAVRYVKFLKRQIRRLQHPPAAAAGAASTTVAAAGDIQGELPLCFGYNEG